MKLSLSIRIVEAPCKTKLQLPIEQLVEIAADTGYDAICMRASGVGIHSSAAERARIRDRVEEAGLTIAMVTADADIPLNNSQGPSSLRDIRPSVALARDLRCDLLRVCLKRREDIPAARQAARIAAAEGVRLAHQCHTHSLFEQIELMLMVLSEIGEPNFGLIYEPANLMLCGEPYGLETLQRLRPHLMNVYVQNHRLDPHGPVSLDTFCLGTRRFHHLPLWSNDGVAFAEVMAGLRAIDYTGYFTIHQAEGLHSVEATHSFASRCAAFVRQAERSAS